LSDCCLTPTQQFVGYITARTRFEWYGDNRTTKGQQ